MIRVVTTGPGTYVQDGGRGGYAHQGVPRSGFADGGSARLANRLVGNASDEPLLEVSAGLTVQTDRPVVIAVTGASVPVSVDDVAVGMNHARWVGAESTVRVGMPTVGVRSYVAVRGGLTGPAEPVLGSHSTDVLSGFGRALERGDGLSVSRSHRPIPRLEVAAVPAPAAGLVRLACVLGPRADRFVDPALLLAGRWTVAPESNRVGVRIDRTDDGPPLRLRTDDQLPSEGVADGSVQVPPSGQPVIFGPDHPVTGGYPVIAVLASGAIDQAMQLRPGQQVQFYSASAR